MEEQKIVYVSYIQSTPEKVWAALTDPDITQRYWGNTRIESTWKVGDKIRYNCKGEITDEHVILRVEPLKILSHTFHPLHKDFSAEAPSRATFEITESAGVVKLSLVHDNFPPNSKVYPACSEGWPMVLSSLKTLLETGTPLPDFEYLSPSDWE